MQLLRTTVHKNWQEITQTQTLEYAGLWRTVQAATILSVLTVLLVGLARFPRPWQDFLRLTASCAVFCGFALRYVYRHHPHANRLTLFAFLLFVGMAAVASLTRPYPATVETAEISHWPVSLSVLTLILGAIVLVTSYRAFPTRMQWLGVKPGGSFLNLIIGAMAGAALGLHLLLSAEVVTGGKYLQTVAWPVLIWTFCTYAGFQALGEELLFRGLSLSVLWDGLHYSFWKGAWRVTFLNLLICLAWLPYNRYTGIWFWLVGYRIVLSLASAFFRHRQKSIIPGLAANVMFNLLAVVVVT